MSAPLFDACIADLGKRRRHAAFRADSVCKTAQKLLPGFACKRQGLLDTRLMSGRLSPCATAAGVIPPAHLPRL